MMWYDIEINSSGKRQCRSEVGYRTEDAYLVLRVNKDNKLAMSMAEP